MIRIILMLLLIYFMANLLLAATMLLVTFIESILNLSRSNDKNKTTESTIEISSYAFGFALAASVLTFVLSLNSARSIADLGYSLAGVFISVELGVMLLILIRRSNNKFVTTVLSIVIFLGIRHLLLNFGYWGEVPVPFIGILQSFLLMMIGNIPALYFILDSSVILFFIFLIPAILKRPEKYNPLTMPNK